jgi:hypothetical protein
VGVEATLEPETDDLPPAGRGKKKAGRAKAGPEKPARRKPRSR